MSSIWEHEEYEFSPWLERAENLGLLADLIQIQLTFEAREKRIGPFRADIVCRNPINGSLVIIANQIEAADHKHLGQLLTYAAGLKAATVIWISESFGDEHIAAIDWLNDSTSDDVWFFAVEVSVVSIGDSLPAPTFNLATKPNWWRKQRRKKYSKSENLSAVQTDSGLATECLQILFEMQDKSTDCLPVIKVGMIIHSVLNCDDGLELKRLARRLSQNGLRIVGNGDAACLVISSNFPSLIEHFQDTQFDDFRWRKVISSIHGTRQGGPRSFYNHQSKTVDVPISTLSDLLSLSSSGLQKHGEKPI